MNALKPYWPLISVFGPWARRVNNLVHWSRKYQYIYVEVPKAACTSIKLTLQRLELDDRCYMPVNENVHDRTHSPLLSPSADFSEFMENLVACDYLRFCIVRNPYTRVLSAYLDKLVFDEKARANFLPGLGLVSDARPSFTEFLTIVAQTEPEARDPHWARQSDLLQLEKISYDVIGRFENFQEDFGHVLRRIGRDASWLSEERQHATNAASVIERYVGSSERETILQIYDEDFNSLGYSRDLTRCLL